MKKKMIGALLMIVAFSTVVAQSIDRRKNVQLFILNLDAAFNKMDAGQYLKYFSSKLKYRSVIGIYSKTHSPFTTSIINNYSEYSLRIHKILSGSASPQVKTLSVTYSNVPVEGKVFVVRKVIYSEKIKAKIRNSTATEIITLKITPNGYKIVHISSDWIVRDAE